MQREPFLDYNPRFIYPRQNVKRFLEEALSNPDKPESPTQLVAFDYYIGLPVERNGEGRDKLVIIYMINTVIDAPHMAPGDLNTYEVIVPINSITSKNPNICDYPLKFLRGLANA